MKYAKFLPHKQRREIWDEIVDRNKGMHLKKFPQLKSELDEAYDLVLDKKILPSMRSMQFAGKPVELNNTRLYNCAFLPIDDVVAFSEVMFLLLSGAGVGYSVQTNDIEKLPAITKPTKTKRYLIGDSIEGWADSIKVLFKAYFKGRPLPVFDYSDIREKGSLLVTAGGKAPGPQPLKDCHHNIRKILDQKESGEQLSSLEVHDILCYIADAVLAGGIRRSAMIALFDITDLDMLTCKFGNWFDLNPQRARANNTAVVVRHLITKDVFLSLWDKVEKSGSGEPGIFFTNDPSWGFNPCVEASLRPFTFCNLGILNTDGVYTQEEFNIRARNVAFICTLQASYTNFHYLRDIWKRNTEKDALIGVSLGGIAHGNALKLNMKEAAQVVKDENERVAKLIGINKAARTTLVKPDGTASLVLGGPSGVHAWHSEYYIRRLSVGKDEAIYKYLMEEHPEILEDDYFKPHIQAKISIPQKAPEGAVTRQETALELLDRVEKVYKDWVVPGHRRGVNKNNVSTTVTVKPHEWEEVGEWLWKNKEKFTALSFFPYDDHTYVQTPFEDCDQETYEKMVKKLHKIDLSQIVESNDETELSQNLACFGGACTIS